MKIMFLIQILICLSMQSMLATALIPSARYNMFWDMIKNYSPTDVDAQQEACNGLRVMTTSPDMVEIEFCSRAAGGGVRILSEVSTQGTGKFLITNMNGETIVDAEKPYPDRATIMSVLGKHFLIKENSHPLLTLLGLKSTAREQVISDKNFQAVRKALYSRRYLKSDSTFAMQAQIQETVTNLLNRAEIEMIHEAVNALAETGLSGKENQAARVLYVYAMGLVDAQQKLVKTAEDKRHLFEDASFASTVQQNYNTAAGIQGYEQCTSYKAKCPRGQCPGDEKCLGMCGPGCHCWKRVCGDCCKHQGCYEHDLCCGREGYISTKCALKLPFTFKCNRYKC